MEKSSRTYLEILLISLIVFSPKWICSYFFFPDEELLVKTLLDIEDVHYFLNVVSFSNFDLRPSFNELISSEKIITFPFFSIIFHSIFYKIIGYSSFIILEFVFIFLSTLIFFKIVRKFDLDKSYSLVIVGIYFSLPFLLNLFNYINLSQISILQDLVSHFIDSRFPRPLVTNIFFLLGIYFLLKLQKELIENKTPKSIINISIIMIFQINSFFYFFLIQFFSTLILILTHKKKDFFNYIFINYKIIIKSFFISSIGLVVFLFQGSFGESDYTNRISATSVNFSDKVFLVKYFFSSLLRMEVLTFIAICTLLFIYIKIVIARSSNQINIFVIFITSSFFSTIFFITFSNNVISLYHFANIFLFSFLLFIFISVFFIINNFKFIKNLLTKFRHLIYLILFFLGLIFSSPNLLDKDLRESYVKIDNILKQLKSNHQDSYLFTNNLQIQTGWLFNGFRNIYLTNGFNNSLNDNQIEEAFSKVLKSTFKENSEFKEILQYKNEKDNYRNSIISYFLNYKYQANSLHTFSDKNDYTLREQKNIKESSPLRNQMHIIPTSEKKRINEKILQQNNRIDIKKLLVVIDKKNWPKNFSLKNNINENFKIIFNNDHYFVAQTGF
tara:strand:- start:1897 stop:3738 length:1842 start_codon:yes stop_codon:yes gene_type:complete